MLCGHLEFPKPYNYQTFHRIESKANLLWIPLESEYNSNTEWLENNFEKDTRDELVVFESENVLTPDSLKHVRNLCKIFKT